MGTVASLMSGKVSLRQGKSFIYGNLYDQFIRKQKINNFEEFHIAFLQIINTINSAVPGRRYDVPRLEEIEAVHKTWSEARTDEERKEVLEEFIRKNVNMRGVDRSMILAGLAAPPAAMVAKRAGESLPQLKMMKVVPDLVFVPTATVVALMGCKLSTTMKRRS